ncbi:unnamed protein product [Lactuca saligna]|uniref:DDE Tnp4 domain-containing protein n=1 Tax=Lactuca saligna TaxID=75948 RepID=A0AA35Y8Y8_LACSI|nr:unnamed protein product [Lactuca saligna]
MHKESWVTIGKALKEKFDMDTSQKQLKNALDNLKAKYVGWIYLRNKSWNLYNAQTNSFALVNTEWEEFKKGHRKEGSLRTHPLPYPNLYASLFDGCSASSSIKWTSTQTTPADTSSSSQCVQRLLNNDNPFNGIEEEDDDDASNDNSARAPIDKAHGGSTYRPDKRAKTSDASTDRPDKMAKTSDASIDRLDKRTKTSYTSIDRTDRDKASKTSVNLDELNLDMQNALQHLVNSKEEPTVEEYYERLKLVGLDPMDPIFFVAFHLFGMSMNMREAWMTLLPIPEDIIVPTSFNPNPNVSRHNRRLRRIFKGAVGTLDGTLVHAIVPLDKQNLYKGRGKGDCYQNVLVISDFNLIFMFFVAGWEGISHNSRILSEALTDRDAPFPFPLPDEYYLCDDASIHTRGFMAPYRNVRYWLGDFHRRRALTNKENFNHSHAKLRNFIERAFGVFKAFDISLQSKNVQDDDDDDDDDEEEEEGEEDVDEVQPHGNARDREFMVHLRDQIANQLIRNVE